VADVIYFPGHRWKHCVPHCDGCVLCHGGLALCDVCGGLEGSLPTDCPGERMRRVVEDDVYAGELDYRTGEGWVQKMSKMWEELRCQRPE
jgi:hypothetical protein